MENKDEIIDINDGPDLPNSHNEEHKPTGKKSNLRHRKRKETEKTKENPSIIFGDPFNHLPDEVTYQGVYDVLAEFLPHTPIDNTKVIFVFLCAIIALFASIYNYSFSKDYVHDIAKRWNFSESDATLFGEMCGIAGLIINLGINTRSINQAYEVIKNEIYEKFKGNGKRTPDDNIIRVMTGIMALVSIIGAIPNLKFVYDTTKGNAPYLVFMEIIQFITTSSLNLVGLHNTFKVDNEKNKIAKKYKKELLFALSKRLIHVEVTKEGIDALCEKILVYRQLAWLRKIISILLACYVGGYASAFFFAAKAALPDPGFKLPPFSDFISFAETGCGLLASALKWFFLGNAYKNFIEKGCSLLDKPILKTKDTEIRPGAVSRNLERFITITSVFVAIFSLGSSSKIVEKFVFEAVEKTSRTFWASLGIGGGAALGINAGASATVITELINFGARLFAARKPMAELDRFGNSHDEMIGKLMYRISEMGEEKFLKEFTVDFTKDDLKLEAMENGVEENEWQPSKEDLEKYLFTLPGLYMKGWRINNNANLILEACEKLETIKDDNAFNAFKQRMAQQIEEQVQQHAKEDDALLSTLSEFSRTSINR